MKHKIKESQLQMQIFEWASYIPQLKWLFHIPNGGTRNIITAVNLKRQGVKKGIPDIFLPIAKHGYHGLFIELKVGSNKPSPHQMEFINFANDNGYKAIICYSFDECTTEILKYIG